MSHSVWLCVFLNISVCIIYRLESATQLCLTPANYRSVYIIIICIHLSIVLFSYISVRSPSFFDSLLSYPCVTLGFALFSFQFFFSLFSSSFFCMPSSLFLPFTTLLSFSPILLVLISSSSYFVLPILFSSSFSSYI